MGKEILDRFISKGKDFIKELGKKVASALLKNPYFYLVVAIFFVIIIITGTMVDVNAEGNTPPSEDGLASASGDSWEQFIRYMHSIEGNEGEKTVDGVKYYKVGLVYSSSLGYSTRTVGYGIDLDTSGYEKTIKEKSGLTSIQAGDWIKAEYVDYCEEQELKAAKKQIEDAFAAKNVTPTEYQIYSLISFCYNNGTGVISSFYSGKGIAGAYKEFYNDVDNSKYYKYDDWAADKSNYMNKIQNNKTYVDFNLNEFASKFNEYTNKGQLTTRRQTDWCLFQTGYYGYGKGIAGYGNGINEYWKKSTNFSSELYNSDGTVNEDKVQDLEYALEKNHNILIPSGKGLNNTWQAIPEGDTNNETRRAVTGEFHGYSGNVVGGKPKGKNGLSTYQCTWWANGRASEYLKQYGTVYKKYPTTSGDGGQYYTVNKNNGYFNYGSTPKPNSLLSTSSSSGYGHVLYIEAVDNVNKYYYASEAGSGYKWAGIQKYSFGHHTCTGSYGFIYLDEPISK